MDEETRGCLEHAKHEPAQLLSQAIRHGIAQLARLDIAPAIRRESLVMIRDTVMHYLANGKSE